MNKVLKQKTIKSSTRWWALAASLACLAENFSLCGSKTKERIPSELQQDSQQEKETTPIQVQETRSDLVRPDCRETHTERHGTPFGKQPASPEPSLYSSEEESEREEVHSECEMAQPAHSLRTLSINRDTTSEESDVQELLHGKDRHEGRFSPDTRTPSRPRMAGLPSPMQELNLLWSPSMINLQPTYSIESPVARSRLPKQARTENNPLCGRFSDYWKVKEGIGTAYYQGPGALSRTRIGYQYPKVIARPFTRDNIPGNDPEFQRNVPVRPTSQDERGQNVHEKIPKIHYSLSQTGRSSTGQDRSTIRSRPIHQSTDYPTEPFQGQFVEGRKLGPAVIPTEVFSEVKWWIHNIHLLSGKQILPPPHSILLETDSSDHSWGANLDLEKENVQFRGHWNLDLLKEHINYKEL
jgi:hypothetical protein